MVSCESGEGCTCCESAYLVVLVTACQAGEEVMGGGGGGSGDEVLGGAKLRGVTSVVAARSFCDPEVIHYTHTTVHSVIIGWSLSYCVKNCKDVLLMKFPFYCGEVLTETIELYTMYTHFCSIQTSTS